MHDIIHINNKLLPSSQASLSPNDRGLLFGDGVFETVHILAGWPLLLKQHWERLHQGAHILAIPCSLTFAALHQAIRQLLQANQVDDEDAILRITLTRGQAPREIFPTTTGEPTLLLVAWAKPLTGKKSLTACLSSIRRNEQSPLAKIKSLNYLDNILARREALLQGVDEAILLNTQGFVAEAASANIFIVKNNCLITPPISDGALPGITRLSVLQVASAFSIVVEEATCSVADLLAADEVFITNSILGIMPITAIAKQTFAPSSLTMTMQLQAALHHYYSQSFNMKWDDEQWRCEESA